VKVFLFRYFVFYGVACLLASIDGTETPEIPKCTSLVYLYSDMWRSFDVGLYNYIHRYVYSPLKSKQVSKSYALVFRLGCSLACFGFVAVFHGIGDKRVLIWTFLNWVGIVLETIAFHFKKQTSFAKLRDFFGERIMQRVGGLLATFLLLMSCFSCYYFLRGVQIGNSFVLRILFLSTNLEFVVLILVLYCGVQVAIEYENFKSKIKQS